MHHLFDLPFEIGELIFACLPQSTLSQLCLTNRQNYVCCLPHLYRHVHFTIRKHWRQLDHGLKRSPILRQVVATYSKQLTLTCCQSSYQWLISPLQAEWTRRWMPHLTTLTFYHFSILPVDRIGSFLTHPSLGTLCFRYCNLVCLNQPEAYIPLLPEDHRLTSVYQLPATYYYHDHNDGDDSLESFITTTTSSISCLELDWTDFSSMAIHGLLQLMPHLTHISLGANHNRIKGANTTALEELQQFCPSIHTLKISLQQIHPNVLPKLIMHYGHNLRHLDIQCQDPATLKTVAHYAKKVEQLVIHGVEGMDELSTQHKRKRRVDGIAGIVQQCGQLVEMKIIRWRIQDIPFSLVLIMARHGWRRRTLGMNKITALNRWESSLPWETSLALDKDLLSELRHTFV
ncbi:hypothetical protein BC941DRAFT_444762 [Chlamydoabsidia padenii]|nr:hypothetical protein BC941DRAFT_444762 [Chlamydoabsidia padenii]